MLISIIGMVLIAYSKEGNNVGLKWKYMGISNAQAKARQVLMDLICVKKSVIINDFVSKLIW